MGEFNKRDHQSWNVHEPLIDTYVTLNDNDRVKLEIYFFHQSDTTVTFNKKKKTVGGE